MTGRCDLRERYRVFKVTGADEIDCICRRMRGWRGVIVFALQVAGVVT